MGEKSDGTDCRRAGNCHVSLRQHALQPILHILVLISAVHKHSGCNLHKVIREEQEKRQEGGLGMRRALLQGLGQSHPETI